MICKFKLSSNFQTIEFEMLFEDGASMSKSSPHFGILDDAIKLINYIGSRVEASTQGTTSQQKKANTSANNERPPTKLESAGGVKMATERQIYALEKFGIDAHGMTSKEAWKIMNELLGA